jgi:sugar transferase (PEP-CTERM/EpsH1 system associated)
MPNHPKIKILHVLHSFNMGGLENGVVNLINNSDKNIFDHEICCVTKSGNAALRLKNCIPVYEMHKQEGNDWRLLPKLARLMKNIKPDIVHTRNWGTVDGIVAAKFARIGAVVHGEHGWNMDDPAGQNIRRRIARRLLSGIVNHFVAVSEDIKQWMINSIGIRNTKVSKILNGVETDKFYPRDNIGIRNSLGFSSEDIVIGTIGRLDPIKDQHLLLQAFSRLKHEQKKLRLLLVGDGPEKRNLESVRKRLPIGDRVLFLGERDDVDKILSAFDFFVLPSRNEGISNTILEAMATGLPVIATDVGGNPELVKHGCTGLLFPPGDCEALVNALNFYIEQNPHMIEIHGRNARERVIREFSLKRMVKEYETLYKSLYFNM